MNLENHLLYIDITQVCGIGCTFCMYADRHDRRESMSLTPRSRQNLDHLINGRGIKRVSVSGEGEPLNNIAAFHEILDVSRGGISFEFITSGFFPAKKLIEFYEDLEVRLAVKGDTCNIRLSSDSYHIEKVKHLPHGPSMAYWLERRPRALTFSFRSVDIDRQFTQQA
jgi:MoaA/NifB/PqqE/SkfB family radical SAM enzyme